MVSCALCPSGYFLPIEKATSATQCRPCVMGTRSGPGAGQCIECPPGMYGRGLHSSTFQLNLSRSSHCRTEANQRIPQKVLTLSRKNGRV